MQKRIIDILGDEDEVVENFVVSTLENPGDKSIDPKKMQLDLTGKIRFILCEFYASTRNYSTIYNSQKYNMDLVTDGYGWKYEYDPNGMRLSVPLWYFHPWMKT